MVRNRKRTTERGKNFGAMERAAEIVESECRPAREVAREFEICHVSLYRYCKKQRDIVECKIKHPPTKGYNPHTRVFNTDIETKLVNYLLQAADLYYGLSPKEVRRFAFNCANSLHLKCPQTWSEKGMASADWFSHFLKRHPEMSIRKPQATSLARTTSFNTTTVNEFSDNLEIVMKRHKFEQKDIYNMDETGVTTVQRPDHISTYY